MQKGRHSQCSHHSLPIPPRLSTIFHFISINMLLFQLFCHGASGNSSDQNPSEKPNTIGNRIVQIKLLSDSFGVTIFTNGVTTNAVFKHVIVFF